MSLDGRDTDQAFRFAAPWPQQGVKGNESEAAERHDEATHMSPTAPD